MQANHYEIQRMAQQIYMLVVVDRMKAEVPGDIVNPTDAAEIAVQHSKTFFEVCDKKMKED